MVGGLIGDVEWLLQLLDFVVSLAVVTAMFALMYKILPRVKIGWRDVWIGATVTALLFTIGEGAGRPATSARATSHRASAPRGALAVLLVWVYYSAQIFLLGAESTWVYAHRFGSRQGQERPGTAKESLATTSSPRSDGFAGMRDAARANDGAAAPLRVLRLGVRVKTPPGRIHFVTLRGRATQAEGSIPSSTCEAVLLLVVVPEARPVVRTPRAATLESVRRVHVARTLLDESALVPHIPAGRPSDSARARRCSQGRGAGTISTRSGGGAVLISISATAADGAGHANKPTQQRRHRESPYVPSYRVRHPASPVPQRHRHAPATGFSKDRPRGAEFCCERGSAKISFRPTTAPRVLRRPGKGMENLPASCERPIAGTVVLREDGLRYRQPSRARRGVNRQP